MANNVHWNLTFYEINDAAKSKLVELCDRVRTDGEYLWFSDLFVDGEELTYEQSEKYSWTTEHIGPKWCYFEEMDTDEMIFSGESAWSAPENGVVKLLQILEEYDPKIVTSLVYEDEMPNFVGASVYHGSECYDSYEDDWNEILERVCEEVEELTGKYDADEGEWADEESEDLFRENIWEITGNAQWQFVDDITNLIKNE
jgi:hypothetical protein